MYICASIVLQILFFVTQNERENIKKRQAQGIATVKTKDVKFDRPENHIPDDFGEIVKAFEKNKISFDDVLLKTGLKRPHFTANYENLNC